jgi:hypothetical protein
VKPVFAELGEQVVASSVICGHTIGVVFVDEEAAPSLSVVWNKTDVILVGELTYQRRVSLQRRLARKAVPRFV